MSLGTCRFCITVVHYVSYRFLKILLFYHSFIRMARTRGRAPARGRGRPRGRARVTAPAQDREQTPEPVIEPPAVSAQQQLMGPGLAQPPPEPVAAPDIQAMLVQILAAIGGMQQAPAPAAPVPQG